jgi:hypothetical protein
MFDFHASNITMPPLAVKQTCDKQEVEIYKKIPTYSEDPAMRLAEQKSSDTK